METQQSLGPVTSQKTVWKRRDALAPPPLRPKRAACGVAGLRSGSGQRDSNHALMTPQSASESAPNLFHLTYKMSPFSAPFFWGTQKRGLMLPK